MKRFIALVETSDEIALTTEGVVAISGVHLFPQINPDTFITLWNEGIVALRQWDQFCQSLFHILTKSGMIDEEGLHVSEYSPGSICRFILANKEVLPEGFRETGLGMMVMQAIKTGAKTIKKGKDIVIDWKEITAYAGPMTDAVLVQMMNSPQRSAILLPIIQQFFPHWPEVPTTETQPTLSDNEPV
ncbi:hypothetical protein GO755_04975 [Spirosoma sp. HMF4905]|uniref:Uncharacterized protein n=1 Tax=Spirosoma arboris TaxID=2682092 RepID=A0A7K1S6D6_9BACT|nr:hypothetical protein [Spirosoma arboris]MVM29377.1 hypothetical protein [Spirosoma arboris]